MHPHELPPELLLQILEVAASSSPATAYALTRVSRWTRTLATPHLQGTTIVVRSPTGRDDHLAQFYLDVDGVTELSANVPSLKETPDLLDRLRSLYIANEDSDPGVAYCFFGTPLPQTARAQTLLVSLAKAPHLQRIAMPCLKFRRWRPMDFPDGSVFHHPIPNGVQEIWIFDRTYARWGPSLSFTLFPNVTHLRLGRIIEGDHQRARFNPMDDGLYPIPHLPALTHFAFEYSTDLIGNNTLVDSRRKNRRTPMEALKSWWPANKQASSELQTPLVFCDVYLARLLVDPQLNCVLVLVRPENVTNFKVPTEGQGVDTQGDQQGPRLLTLELDASPNEDWKLWERLAKEDRNVWDEALHQMRARGRYSKF